MICPKCKNQISEKSLKCGECGSRIGVFCKECNAYNSVYNLNCVNCNNVLLKVCPSCKSINFPEAKTCRKCRHDFLGEEKGEREEEKEELEQDELENSFASQESTHPSNLSSEEKTSPTEPFSSSTEEESPEPVNLNFDATFLSQQMAKELLIEGIKSSDKKIISLSGPKGIGKSIVLKSAIHELKEQEITWILGECTPITQLSPCGLIQDILLSFFNVTNFCLDSLKLKKDSQKFFQTEFSTLTNDEIFDLLNFLYPTNTDFYENIFKNKEKTFTFLQKVFKTIIENNKTIFIIDNFDLIDGLSYEFLNNLLNSLSTKNFKFLLTYNELRPARGYLYSNSLSENSYLDVSLKNFDKNQSNSFIEQCIPDEKCPPALRAKMVEISGGIPAVLEQTVNLVMDFTSRNNSYEIDLPVLFDNVVKMRLEYLKENPIAYDVLSTAAIQGIKLYPSIISQIIKLDDDKFVEVLNELQRLNFIVPVNEFSYAFKNSILWESVFEFIRHSESFVKLNENLFEIYSHYVLSSNSILAVIAQNLNQGLSALNAWTDNIKLASYIGDTNLYVISQKQCLILAEELSHNNHSLIKNNIYERLGKLLSSTHPTEAMDYLPDAIVNAKNLDNVLKEIELTGYLASCCISLGDYYGTLECIDFAIEKIDDSYELEVAMLKSRKLDALLNIGNSGQMVNLIDNEILPIFDKYINAKPHKNISIKSLYEAWLKTYLILANALILQGDNRSFEVISTLFDLLQKNGFEDKLFICKVKLALAFANTIKGEVEVSEEILTEIIRLYKTDIMDNEAISRWNLINILNNVIHKKYNGLKEELFQVVTFANNINDHFTKNILKSLLGKMFKDDENAKHALEIYSEQITYFAKAKNSIGALLTWYLIAEANLIAEGPEKSLEVSQKALEVAQSTKINNYFFIVLYNKIIAEAYMVQSEYEFAKVHIEKAILVARKFEMLDLLVRLYLLYGKYLQDIALVSTDGENSQLDYVMGASKMYKKAGLIAKGIKNNYLIGVIDKAKTVLNSFCQLNGINLHEKE